MVNKHIDSINMNKDSPAYGPGEQPEFKPSAEAKEDTPPEIFEHEGVKIYEKNTDTGNVTYFDTNGDEVSQRVVDILFEKYPAPSEFNQQGGEKKGELQLLEADYQQSGRENLAGKEVKYIQERQDYTEGESYLATIPKEQYKLVQFLRGEFSQSGK